MILGNSGSDSRFGGTQADPLEPADKNNYPEEKSFDRRPVEQRWSLLRLEYMSKWYQRHRDISRYINPKRGFFEGMVPNYNQQYDYRLIIDDNPAYYASIYASGMQAGLTNQAERWFRLGFGMPDLEERDGVKGWLERVEKTAYQIFSKCGFYPSTLQSHEEVGLFGVSAFGMFENYKTVARSRAYTVGEYYLGCDPSGSVNAFARQYWMTVEQIVDEYGWKNASDKTQNLYRAGNRDQYVLVYTLCEENRARIPNFKDFKGMPFRSVTWESMSEPDKVLRARGHREFPYMTQRGRMTTTADIYGTGPGFDSLGNIKMLYRMQKDALMAINKVADPPVQADASVEGAVNTLPGGVTRTSATVPNAGLRPAYEVNPDIKSIEGKIQSTDQKIASRFFVDIFKMMLNTPQGSEPETARAIAEKHEEKLFLLGPVLGSSFEMLDNAVDRVFGLMLRAGLVPPPPPEIQGLPLRVEYISMLALAQKQAGLAAIEQEASFVGALSAKYPQALDNYDPDEAVRQHAQMVGCPSAIILSKDAVAKIRDHRAKLQQQVQSQQQAMAAVQAAGVLAKSRVGKGNALEQMLGTEPAQDGQPAQA